MVKGVLACLEIPSLRAEMAANRRAKAAERGDARTPLITIEQRSIPLRYPVGLSTLQVNGVHLRLAPKNTASKSSSAGAEPVRVNVVVKVVVRGDFGDVPAQEFIAAVVPLKYDPAAPSSISSSGGSGGGAVNHKHNSRSSSRSSRKEKEEAAELESKFLSSTGHLPFNKRKLNAMRREQQQEQGAGAAGAVEALSQPVSAGGAWEAAEVGPAAFASLDVRVQMERVRIVIELQPMVERMKRPRQAEGGEGRRGQKGGAQAAAKPAQLDCALEVSVLGTNLPRWCDA